MALTHTRKADGCRNPRKLDPDLSIVKMKKRQTEQLDRFKKKARELDADESPDALDRSFDKLDLKQRKEAEKERKRGQSPSDSQ